jgi:predicted ATPase/DNA-binding CsgD family transcriptional regulator
MLNHPLPTPATPFVGRTEELGEISALLADPSCRLLTVLGVGGIGKTRLALEVMERVIDRFAHGVQAVNFQPVASIDALASTITDALNIGGREPPQTRLLTFLREKEMLLVLDNLEHLLEGVEWLSDLLATAPGLKLLTTSREALKLQEEWLYPIRGLSYPISPNDGAIEGYDAVGVFLQIARRVQPNFLISRERAGLVRICRQTEGIPLAVEMAASWVKVLSCDQIADEMQSSLNFLMATARNVPERHRSMRAVFAHSWRLLQDEERQVFRRLSIFHGGFTFHAAERVAGASLSVLAALVEKSLVRRQPASRYDMHELLRQFAAEKLLEDADEENTVRNRHSAYYVEFLHRLTKAMRNEGEYDALQAIEEELDNVRACWEHVVEHVNIEAIWNCQESLRVFYTVRDRYHEGETAFGRAAAAVAQCEPGEERDVTLATLLEGQGKCCLRIGQLARAQELLETSIRTLRGYNAPRELSWALYELGIILYYQEEFREAARVKQEALALAEVVGEEALIAGLYFDLSYTVRMYGDYAASLRYMEESLPRLIKTGDEDGVAMAYRGLADRLRERGEYSRAKQLYQQGLEIHRKLNYKTKLANAMQGMSETLSAMGDYEGARAVIEEGLALSRESGYPHRLAFSLVYLGNVLQMLGKPGEAEPLYQESLEIAIKIGERRLQALSLRGLGRIAFHRGWYADAQRFFLESLSLNQQSDFPLEITISLSDLSLVAVALGNTLEARQLFLDALRIGLEIQLAPVLLETIVGIAGLFSAEGIPARAIPLLELVLDHPASHHNTKVQAQQLLDDLKADHWIRTVTTARKPGYAKTVETAAAHLLTELSTTPGHSPAQGDQADSLSQRELEILRLIGEGLSNHAIGERLILSEGTIKWYTTQLYAKLGVQNRAQAVRRAQELNLLP